MSLKKTGVGTRKGRGTVGRPDMASLTPRGRRALAALLKLSDADYRLIVSLIMLSLPEQYWARQSRKVGE